MNSQALRTEANERGRIVSDRIVVHKRYPIALATQRVWNERASYVKQQVWHWRRPNGSHSTTRRCRDRVHLNAQNRALFSSSTLAELRTSAALQVF
jgi:hypothetical protein